ncbi:Hpt domain-containing protein [Psychrobacter urativorans]|uniref:Chemotaxis protein CheA n=1 Tax=Psychrobacter urativorans TaxID=45610 RepID=A0A0M4T1V0_9GAMM|nr:Hpt domain-containing protein [Psychrobacter urativorans]ALF59415.1 chemotaxis protein CheY [Psychrobacter urativorans]
MKNQPNEMVTLEWLLPLFNEQLSQLSDGWQKDADPVDSEAIDFEVIGFAAMMREYHQLSSTLVMVNLPRLADLAAKLSLLAEVGNHNALSAEQCRKARFAHQLLQYELTQYVQTGSYRGSLLVKTSEILTQIVANTTPSEQVNHEQSAETGFTDASKHTPHDAATFHHDVSIVVPKVTAVITLQAPQYRQLLTVWRRKVQKLLAENSNQLPILTLLEKVSHYLWNSTSNTLQQRLWYVTELWLNSLAQNDEPLPLEYAALLAKLEQVIDAYCLQTEQESHLRVAQALSQPDLDKNAQDSISVSHHSLSSHLIENLIADIYIQLSSLPHINAHAQTILNHLPQSTDAILQFLPRILSEIEAVIFGLAQPRTLLQPLQQIKRQLGMRGWTLYESQVSQIIADLTESADSEAFFTQMQWQIERELQELYSAIYDTEQSIRHRIGDATSFVSSHSATTSKQHLTPPVTLTQDDDALRQLRIAVEEVKHSFNDYVQRQQSYLLPTPEAFAEISGAFDDMGLLEVRQVTDKLGVLFAQLAANDIKVLSWNLIQALADGLSSIELLLDYLAQQVFDQPLLAQASFHTDNAEQLVAALILNPFDSMASEHLVTHRSAQAQVKDVVRYDDSGEIIPNIVIDVVDSADTSIVLSVEDSNAEKSTVKDSNIKDSAVCHDNVDNTTDLYGGQELQGDTVVESAVLQAARSQLQADSFELDKEIRNNFIEEAYEIISDVEEFLSIWAQDSQDLTPLMEVRRGFHTLKDSGRLVGAFSISEMAWAIENLLNRMLDQTLSITDQVVELVLQTSQYLPILVADFNAAHPPSIDPAITILQSNNLLSGQPIDDGMNVPGLPSVDGVDGVDKGQNQTALMDNNAKFEHDYATEENSLVEDNAENIDIKNIKNQEDSSQEDEVASAHSTAAPCVNLEMPLVLVPFLKATEQLPADTLDADPDIKEIFIEEAEEVLAEIIPLHSNWQQAPEILKALPDIRRGFHTLKGSGRMVGANYTGELAWAIEDMLNRILDHTIQVSADIVELIGDVLAAYPELIKIFAEDDSTATNKSYPAIVPLWVACAQAYSKQLGAEFNYPDVRAQWLDRSFAELSDSHATTAIADETNIADVPIDNALETFHAVNEKMAEAPAVMSDQSKEEQEFCKIFVDEAQTLLQDINDFASAHKGQLQVEVSDKIVRAFHTLRAASGSSALVAISEVSAAIEQSLVQLQQQDIMMNAQHLQALTQSTALIESYLMAYEQSVVQQSVAVDTDATSQEAFSSLQMMLSKLESMPKGINSKLSVAQLLKSDVDGLLDADYKLRPALSNPDAEDILTYIQQQRAQIARLSTQTTKSPKFTLILSALDNAYEHISEHPESVHSESMQQLLLAGHAQLVSLFDSLAGSMSLKIDAQVIVDLQTLSTSDADIHDTLFDESINAEVNEAPDCVNEIIDTTIDATTIDELSTDNDDIQSAIVINAVESVQADELQLEAIDTDIELLEVFLEEAQELDSAIAQTFSKWRTDIDNIAILKTLQRHLHTIKGGARMAGIHSIGDLTNEAESVYDAFVEARLQPTAQWLTVMQLVQGTLSLQIDYVVRYQESFFAQELIAQLQQFERADELPTTVTLVLPALQNHMGTNEDTELGNDADIEAAYEIVSLDSLIVQSWTDGLPDPDILEVFLEEADELIASSNKYLQLFLNNISDIVALQALQRDLHTIKGGARMVAANGIADLAHEMETVYEELAIRRRPATKMISQLLVTCHDWLADAVFVLKSQLNPPMPSSLVTALQQFSKNPDSLKSIPIESLQTQLNAIFAAKTKRESVLGVDSIALMPPMAGSFTEQEQSNSTNEMMRISGSLIERMINLSGESAINRARIDMGMSSLTLSIEEMGTTVQRLADQLRRMEIELEQQILSQIDDEELIANEDFDPLEMDQYSSLNQLSKSLTESASDLIDINSTLLEKTRDSENLLLELSRTQTELQDGLMNSRMVPFARLTPRLERIVRQTANELNKSVELSIVNADDEMDRTILERITSPLEHMLRNAVDHGIESPQTRMNAGKNRSGQITLEILREGSEIVIHLTDDGRGINVDAVRRKAISQGLIDANDNSLSELDVMQYIFNAGLTTTKQVTQISGRGVGMDVVISEVRQLGGVVSVTSESGQGSCFTLRVPLTVAVSDALVVRAADRYYAIPLVQIERVVRINPEKLYDYYQSGEPTMRIEEADYRVRYLNDILTGNKLNELVVSTNTSLPVIIVKNRAGQKLALQVDQIAGSRIEVVVKPLGKQLSHLAGISAATIMGDGSVMLILDLIALLRNAPALKESTKALGANARNTMSQTTVLVVDDSVTVRKVTSRFLERQGITAVVAKDGIDAMEILQELTPDLILLDIEMPRMDGFEVATQVRFNKRLRQIPIIMITSRTGEKHREHAFEIGVNDYMGKPFQEKELLGKIQNLLGTKISLTHDG